MATTAPIPAKFVDNAYHEYNATIKMSITTSQLDKVLNAIQVTAKTVKYDIDDYNCTNFAIDIFNMVRSTDPIVPARIHIPGTINTNGSLTPQGLYLELVRRKKHSAVDRSNIRVSSEKVNAGQSQSPCK